MMERVSLREVRVMDGADIGWLLFSSVSSNHDGVYFHECPAVGQSSNLHDSAGRQVGLCFGTKKLDVTLHKPLHIHPVLQGRIPYQKDLQLDDIT